MTLDERAALVVALLLSTWAALLLAPADLRWLAGMHAGPCFVHAVLACLQYLREPRRRS